VLTEVAKPGLAQPAPADISVVICAYTEARWADLCAAVESVHCQTAPPREVIVVVDHNPSLLQRAHLQWPGAVVIENGQPRGLSGARNSGLAAAHGEILAFLDDDAMAAPDWLARLCASYSDAGILGVGGAIEPLWSNEQRPAWFPEEFDWVVGCTYRGMPLTLAPVRNLIGCNMSLRREVFAEVGGFRTGIGRVNALPFGCEETELCIRAGQRWPRGRLLYQPLAKVSHRVSAARGRWSYFCSRCYAEGVSKAQVARFTGLEAGLSSERRYVAQALPLGVLRNLGQALGRRDGAGLMRAGAMVVGLALTAAGFVKGSLSIGWQRRVEQPGLIA
jgi:glucosyl-dolichyl phosphate glucuronosyltransferase